MADHFKAMHVEIWRDYRHSLDSYYDDADNNEEVTERRNKKKIQKCNSETEDDTDEPMGRGKRIKLKPSRHDVYMP